MADDLPVGPKGGVEGDGRAGLIDTPLELSRLRHLAHVRFQNAVFDSLTASGHASAGRP
ncbi:hypothetical protein [Micromonospora rubida]